MNEKLKVLLGRVWNERFKILVARSWIVAILSVFGVFSISGAVYLVLFACSEWSSNQELRDSLLGVLLVLTCAAGIGISVWAYDTVDRHRQGRME